MGRDASSTPLSAASNVRAWARTETDTESEIQSSRKSTQNLRYTHGSATTPSRDTDPSRLAAAGGGDDDDDNDDGNAAASFDADEGSELDHDEDKYNGFAGAARDGSEGYTKEEEETVIRKLDRKLVLFLAFLYMLSFLDRSNIGNARIAGLESALLMGSEDFDLCLVAFYITYILFEWTILLYRLIPPHIYISLCVLSWGIVASLQSVVTSFRQLLILRAFLGVTEAAFGPGVPFYMTFFYRRSELAYRVGLQIAAAPLATSFASSLAWVIVKISQNTPLESWRALFLFEGFPSVITAVFAFYYIPDSPSTVRYLTPRERQVATLRLQTESTSASSDGKLASQTLRQSASSSPSSYSSRLSTRLNVSELRATLLDPKAYLQSFMFFSVNVSFASLPVFLPTVIRAMSFSALTSQILAAPPYLLAFFFVLMIGRWSDRVADSRAVFLALCAGMSALSYLTIALTGALLGDSSTLGIWMRYAAVYSAALGLFSSVVLIITWTLNNQESSSGKGMGMVILNVVGQCGPLIGVNLFPESHGPAYVPGMAICAAFMGAVCVLSLVLRAYLKRLNTKVHGFDATGNGAYEMVGLTENGEEGEDGEEQEMGRVDGEEEFEVLVEGRPKQERFRFML